MLAISTGDDVEKIKEIIASKQLSLPVLLADGAVQKSFGGASVPETFLVKADGTIVEHVKGPRGKEFFEEKAKMLLGK